MLELKTPTQRPGVPSGLTIIELMVVIIIIAVLAAYAVPALQDTIKNNRITAQNNELIALINLARNEAIRRNVDGETLQSILRLDTSGTTWTANVDITGGETGEGCPAGVIRCASHERVVLSGADQLAFNNRGYLQGEWVPRLLCLRHDDCSGPLQHRQIRVLPSGQVESTSLACNDACPPEAEEE